MNLASHMTSQNIPSMSVYSIGDYLNDLADTQYVSGTRRLILIVINMAYDESIWLICA